MILRRAAAAGLVALALGGCETTAEKSARLAREGRAKVRGERGLSITAVSPDVRVVSSAVLSDQNGTVATVTLQNTSTRALANVPVAISVLDARGSVLFQNNAPGLEQSLTSVPLLAPHVQFTWVDDQVQASGRPASVTARVGRATPASAAVPRLTVGAVSLYDDVTSGLGARGTVVNHSTVSQQKLVVFGVARRGGRVVAAGRAILPKVDPGKPVPFTVYFIGDPRGATLQLSAPPTTLP